MSQTSVSTVGNITSSSTMGPQPETVDMGSTNTEWLMEEIGLEDSINEDVTVHTKLLDNHIDNGLISGIPDPVDLTVVDSLYDDIDDLPDIIKDSSSTETPVKKYQPLSQRAHCITEACVSGFVPIKHGLNQIKDMAYIVEVTWSDGRTHMIKRTFTDFYFFHYDLLEEWGTKECKNGLLKLTFYLPERQNGETEPSIEVAECRELQLNKYVQELIKLPQTISASPTVLTFFESRGSDPKPYREIINPSQMEVADQYVLCWI